MIKGNTSEQNFVLDKDFLQQVLQLDQSSSSIKQGKLFVMNL